ncbi:hypothetical protein [Falsirhodobacter halotolerans]|uniref:hypothetical protein n=1 Tax=Falsirhodobacter halotolerans TaxID=1146892 RepID=UPI001FD210E8|nr:hypothetical protein [Falsirhodobacter halotolerans]MCJ8139429.1 hypothetical protein [Falsirhodobacter halotolerans]
MISFLRRSLRFLGTAEYTVLMGAVWVGPMPIPLFRISGNEACRLTLLVTLWLATAGLTALDLALGGLPGPKVVTHWMQTVI